VFCESLSGALITEFGGCFGLRPDPAMAELGQQIPQPRVERVLRQHLATEPMVELLFGARVTDIEQTHECATVRAVTAQGSALEIQADYVLGCDGASGLTRTSQGISFVGNSDLRPNFNMVFRAPTLHTDLPDAVQYWVVGAGTPGVIGRLDLDGLWWAIATGVDAESGNANPSALVHSLVGRAFEHDVLSTDPWTARMLVAERFRSERVFLVGEAAHLNPPWGGHGFNTCVGDAVNIAWKLAAVLQGWGHESLLETYELERRPIAEDTIEVAVANMATLSTDLAHAPQESLAESIQREKYAEFHSLGLVLGYTYAGSPITADDMEPVVADPYRYMPSTRPGGRLPHATLPDGSALFDHLGRGFTVVGRLHDAGESVAAFVEQADALGVPLNLVETPADYPQQNEYLLVRPDQHIAARANEIEDINLAAAVGRQQLGALAIPHHQQQSRRLAVHNQGENA